MPLVNLFLYPGYGLCRGKNRTGYLCTQDIKERRNASIARGGETLRRCGTVEGLIVRQYMALQYFKALIALILDKRHGRASSYMVCIIIKIFYESAFSSHCP